MDLSPGRRTRPEMHRAGEMVRSIGFYYRSGVENGRSYGYVAGENGWSCLRLARISHHLTAEARDKPIITSLRLLTVLTVLFKYASAR